MCRLYPKNLRISLTVALLLLVLHLINSPSALSADYTLTVTIVGAGDGTVNSEVNNLPASIACSRDASTGCSAIFNDVDPVTLLPTADWKSIFDGWSGGVCSGNGNCVITLSGDTVETATFSPNFQAALIITLPDIEPKFASLNDAYEYANINGKNNFSLNARVNTFFEDLILSHQINFTLAGGKNSGYYTNVEGGFTALQGYLEVQQGSVEIDSLIIQ